MLLLASTSDLLEVVTGAAATDINVHVSYADNNAGTVTPDRRDWVITTATTTTVVGSPGASIQRNVRHLNILNSDPVNNVPITIQHFDGTNTVPLFSCTLLPGEELVFTGNGLWVHYDIFGGMYQAAPQSSLLFNGSSAAQGPGFASDTYLVGSNILMPSSGLQIGTRYRLRAHISKTAAGTATPIFNLRFGTNASTADASLCTFTFAAGTAAIDVALIEVDVIFRSVGAGTAAVVAAIVNMSTNLTTTGLSNNVKNVQVTSSGFDSTIANSYMGLSVNGGTSAVWTVQLVEANLENF